MNILGIDPGFGIIGFGFIRADGHVHTAGKYGVIRTESGIPFEQRLLSIEQDIVQLIENFKPDVMAIEELYFNQNITTGIQVAEARGVLLLTAARAELPIYEYNPATIKMTVTGYGKAEKKQVIAMVRQLLRLPAPPKPDDAADALAVALCHAYHAPMAKAIQNTTS